MKKSILFLSLCTGLLFAACKKDKKEDPPGTDRLKGHWELLLEVDTDYENGTEVDRDTDTYDPGEQVYEFRGDSLLLYTNGVRSNEGYTYKVIDNELVIRQGAGGYFFRLTWYHNDRMSLGEDETYTTSTGVVRRNVYEMFFNRKQ